MSICDDSVGVGAAVPELLYTYLHIIAAAATEAFLLCYSGRRFDIVSEILLKAS